MSQMSDDPSQASGDAVITGDPQIDEALAQLATIDRLDVGEHPAEYEQVHRVLRDSLTGVRRDDGPRNGS